MSERDALFRRRRTSLGIFYCVGDKIVKTLGTSIHYQNFGAVLRWGQGAAITSRGPIVQTNRRSLVMGQGGEKAF